MKKEKISGGGAVLAHVLFLLFFVPFAVFVTYIVIDKNNSTEGVVFLIIFLAIILLILRHILSYADIYLGENIIIVKKIFTEKKKSVAELQRIDRALLPFTYYIEFKNGNKEYFFLKSLEILHQVITLDRDKILKELRLKFKQRGEEQ